MCVKTLQGPQQQNNNLLRTACEQHNNRVSDVVQH